MGNVGMSLKVNKNFDFKEMKKDISRLVRNTLKTVSTNVADELAEVANYAILRFYESYAPKVYIRNYYNFLDNSYKKYYLNKLSKDQYSAGIQLTPSNMDDLYQDDVYDVFESVMFRGVHGWFSDVSPTRPSPIDIIYNARDNIVYHCQDYVDRALDSVKRGDYGLLKFS